MPIYEYQCEECGVIVENWQKISDPPLEKCESCGGRMKKLISQSSFHLKGSGWYVTDYKGKSQAGSDKKAESASKADSKGSSKDSSSSGTGSGPKSSA